jgi:NADPH:quinone reductase-like Zn-dependent oxidoreductase
VRAAILESTERPPSLGEFEEPEADSGKALVDVAVAGLNPIDLAIASGVVPGRLPELPAVAGMEGVGTMAGRRVYFDRPVAPFGAMAERALVDTDCLIDVPDGVADALAVCFGVAGLAAWLALEWRAHLGEGESVLVLGASGVVGQIAIQAAKLLGAGRVVAAARSDEGLALARELGADATVRIDGAADLSERMKDAGEGGFDVVLDPIWGPGAMAALEALNLDGRLIQIGNAASPSAEMEARPFRNRLASIIGHTNFHAPQERKTAGFTRMCEHAAAGELRVGVEERPLAEIEAAWREQGESPHHKLVLRTGS